MTCGGQHAMIHTHRPRVWTDLSADSSCDEPLFSYRCHSVLSHYPIHARILSDRFRVIFGGAFSFRPWTRPPPSCSTQSNLTYLKQSFIQSFCLIASKILHSASGCSKAYRSKTQTIFTIMAGCRRPRISLYSFYATTLASARHIMLSLTSASAVAKCFNVSTTTGVTNFSPRYPLHYDRKWLHPLLPVGSKSQKRIHFGSCFGSRFLDNGSTDFEKVCSFRVKHLFLHFSVMLHMNTAARSST